jgi:hypothetical protein
VILRGAGGNFSSGYDMNEVLEHVKAHAKPHFHSRSSTKLANLPQPVISAVQGHCSTGALELALAADLIVASESAQFSDVYARWGLTPSGAEPAAAASGRHRQGERDDVHLPQLLGAGGAEPCTWRTSAFPDDRNSMPGFAVWPPTSSPTPGTPTRSTSAR